MSEGYQEAEDEGKTEPTRWELTESITKGKIWSMNESPFAAGLLKDLFPPSAPTKVLFKYILINTS